MRDKTSNQVIAEMVDLQHEMVVSINSSSAELYAHLINYFMEQLLRYVMDQFLHHFFADLHRQHHKTK